MIADRFSLRLPVPSALLSALHGNRIVSLSTACALSLQLAHVGLLAQAPKQEFTATMVSATFHGDSTTANISEEIAHARRYDGSLATLTRRTIGIPAFSTKPESIEWHEVLDATRRTRAIMYPALHRKSTTPLTSESATSMRRAAPAGCRPAEPDVEYDSAPSNSPILGFRVVSVTRTYTTPDGSRILSKVYLAPDLDCFALQSESNQTDSVGTLLSRRIMRTVNLTQGPPRPDIFQIRTEYVESTPSDIYDEDSTKRGKAVDTDCASAAKARSDARYHELRSH